MFWRHKLVHPSLENNRLKHFLCTRGWIACLQNVNVPLHLSIRDVAQSGSAPALGAGGREFKSPHPDSFNGST